MRTQWVQRGGRWRTAAFALALVLPMLAAFQTGVAAGFARANSQPEADQVRPLETVPPRGKTTDFGSSPAETATGTDLMPHQPKSVSPPTCRFDDVASTLDPTADWATTVLDTTIALDADYEPADLVDASSAGLNGGHLVRAIVVPDLRAMAQAARRAGAALAIQSSYRSFAEQAQTFASWVAVAGRSEALRRSARPGHSEHQLGTAIDFRSASTSISPWRPHDWSQTRPGAWLLQHAWRFGFVMSYPRGAFERTCYAYEPWHYRFVGRTTAAAIHASGLTPREWLWAEL